MRRIDVVPGRRYITRRGEVVRVVEMVPADPYPHLMGRDEYGQRRDYGIITWRLSDDRRITSRELERLA